MTAPLPMTGTGLVVSEKGSRLSLPSTVRAPLTVTGTSSATGCCLMAVSPGSVEVGAGRWAVSGFAAKISFSLTVGGIACTLTKDIFFVALSPTGSPRTSICSASRDYGYHTTCVLRWQHSYECTGEDFAGGFGDRKSVV